MSRSLRSTAALLAVVAIASLGTSFPAAASVVAAPGTVLATIGTGPKPQDVVVSPDGRHAYVTTLEDGAVAEIDLGSFVVTRTLHVGTTAGAILWFDGELVVADAATPALVFVDPDSFTVSRTLPLDGDAIALTSSPDGPNGPLIVYSAFDAQSLGVVTLDLTEDDGFGQVGSPWGVALFDGGSRAISADTAGERVVFSGTTLGSGGPYSELWVGGRPSYIAVSPDETLAYVANADRGVVDVVSLEREVVSTTFTVGGKPWGVAVSWEGDYLYVPDNSGGTVIAVDARSGTVLSVTPTGEHPDFVALSPDGTLVLVPNSGSNTLSVVQGYSSPPSTGSPGDGAAEDGGGTGDGGSDDASVGSGGMEIGILTLVIPVVLVVLAGITIGIVFLVRAQRRAVAPLPGAPGFGAAPAPVGLDPATTPADLSRLAQDPAFRAAVAAHPNAYPELLAWLAGLGDPAVDAALRARRFGQ